MVLAKIMLQELWLSGLDWDTIVPQQIDNKWREFRNTLKLLNEIGIPRYVGLGYEGATYELHGFCDASTKAYAAAVYLRCVYETGDVEVKLLVAKSRVATTKTISIPRLELCGALLLANLMERVNTAMKIKFHMTAWTDSMITLAWINGNLQRWETFVANRVSKIRDLVECKSWHHVGTKDNRADVASRGLDATELKTCDIWWNGPSWLSKRDLDIEAIKIQETTLGMRKSHALVAVCDSKYQNMVQRFSSYRKSLRVLAFCQRFAANCRAQEGHRQSGPLMLYELRAPYPPLIKWAQKNDFEDEIRRLESGGEISQKSKIISLNPFMDDGLMRVRGRIQSDNLPYARIHPIILAYSNVLTTFIRHRFWILKVKRAVKTIIRKCVTCFKYRAQTREQQMGKLPIERTTEARPFFNSGVDFCGPFDIKNMVGRGSRTSKG